MISSRPMGCNIHDLGEHVQYVLSIDHLKLGML